MTILGLVLFLIFIFLTLFISQHRTFSSRLRLCGGKERRNKEVLKCTKWDILWYEQQNEKSLPRILNKKINFGISCLDQKTPVVGRRAHRPKFCYNSVIYDYIIPNINTYNFIFQNFNAINFFIFFYYNFPAIVTCLLQMTLKYEIFGNMISFTHLLCVYRNQNRQKWSLYSLRKKFDIQEFDR